MAFNDRLKSLRNEKGITQDELSKLTGIKKSSIGMYESGQRVPKYKPLRILADFFHVSTDYLIGHSPSTEELRAYMDEQPLGNGPPPTKQKPGYFLDPETVRLANEMKENPGRRVLFDATRNLSPEKIKQVKDFVDFITRDQDFSE